MDLEKYIYNYLYDVVSNMTFDFMRNKYITNEPEGKVEEHTETHAAENINICNIVVDADKKDIVDVLVKIYKPVVYTEEMFKKRVATKEACFKHLHPQIIPMLEELKNRGFKIGLISNCYFEEAKVIRESELFSYFDVACLSCELGVGKPEKEIYEICMKALSVNSEECVYVGDGGSFELETARELGMTAVQAVWYLREGTSQPRGRMKGFEQAKNPMDILRRCER